MPVNFAANSFSSLETDPLRNFKFHVNIMHPSLNGQGSATSKSIASLGFTSCSGLSVNTEAIPYRQGGYNTTVHQIPGQTTFSPITLQKGVQLGKGDSWQWMRQLFSTVAGNGNFNGGRGGGKFRATVEINVLDHPVTGGPGGGTATKGALTAVRMKFKVYNCWITALSYSDLNAGDNALLVEQMTLVHEGFDMHLASTTPGQDAAPFAH